MSQTDDVMFVAQDSATPGDPYARLRYHYGMLLNAADLSVEQRGILLRRRIHHAALHGVGTVAGLAVDAQTKPEESLWTTLRVHSGLALDALGRDLFLPTTHCLSVEGLGLLEDGSFWSELEPVADDDVDSSQLPDGVALAPDSARRVYVVLRYQECPSHPVPTVQGACAPGESGLTHSRMLERPRIDVVARAPDTAFPGTPPIADVLANGDGGTLRDALLRGVLKGADALLRLTGERDAPVLLASVTLGQLEGDARVVILSVDNAIRPFVPDGATVAAHVIGAPVAAPRTSRGLQVSEVRNLSTKERFVLELDFSEPVRTATVLDALEISTLLPGEADTWVAKTKPQREAALDMSSRSRCRIEFEKPEHQPGALVQVCLTGAGPKPVVALSGRVLQGMWYEPELPHGHGRDVCVTQPWNEESET